MTPNDVVILITNHYAKNCIITPGAREILWLEGEFRYDMIWKPKISLSGPLRAIDFPNLGFGVINLEDNLSPVWQWTCGIPSDEILTLLCLKYR